MNEPTRLEMLAQFLEQNPADAFARYGLAMEYARLGQHATALEQFNKLLELHPDYTNAYFMAPQTLAKSGRTKEARTRLTNPLASPNRTGTNPPSSTTHTMLYQ